MEIMVLNPSYEAISVLDVYDSLIWTDRYNSYGDFEISLIMDNQYLEFIAEDNYLQLPYSEHTMIIEELEIDTDIENGDHLIIKGRSLESILERRIIWGQKTFNGNLQNAIQSMIDECFISPSISERAINNFRFVASEDPKITELTIDEQYIGDNLYDVIKSLCEENNIGFKLILADDGWLEFSLYAGIDRSYGQIANPYVIFSPNFENLIGSNFFHSKSDYRNVTLVAGEGEGTERKLVSVGSGSGINRRELFTDASDISSKTEDDVELTDEEYSSQLASKGFSALAEHVITTAFEGEAEVERPFKFGEDFFIGDIVQIANEYGNEGAAYISELIISRNAEKFSIYPTFKAVP